MVTLKVPLLTYHGVEIPGLPGPGHPRWESRYAVTSEAFATQMAWLAASGIRVLSLVDLLGGKALKGEGDARRVVLTFDDGYASDVAFVLPELRARGFEATFFVETGAVGQEGRPSRRDLRTLAAAGMEIGSHTVTHRFLSELPAVEVRREIEDSKRFLEDLLGAPVRFLSLPGGRLDGRTEAIARECGYEAVCTSIPGATDPVRPGYLLPRLRIGRRTGLADFQRLVALAPWRLAREHVRYWSLRGMKGLLGRSGYPRVRAALIAIQERRSGVEAHG